MAHFYKRVCDVNGDASGVDRAENAGKHGDAFFREYVGERLGRRWGVTQLGAFVSGVVGVWRDGGSAVTLFLPELCEFFFCEPEAEGGGKAAKVSFDNCVEVLGGGVIEGGEVRVEHDLLATYVINNGANRRNVNTASWFYPDAVAICFYAHPVHKFIIQYSPSLGSRKHRKRGKRKKVSRMGEDYSISFVITTVAPLSAAPVKTSRATMFSIVFCITRFNGLAPIFGS